MVLWPWQAGFLAPCPGECAGVVRVVPIKVRFVGAEGSVVGLAGEVKCTRCGGRFRGPLWADGTQAPQSNGRAETRERRRFDASRVPDDVRLPRV